MAEATRTTPAAPAHPSREILRLAVPAFLALVAEPLFLLADSAIVGHLGTTELAGLGAATAALSTAASVFVFLAYGTTSVVARRLGAGDLTEAIRGGLDGLWLAILLGVATAALVLPSAGAIIGAFGVGGEAHAHGTAYLAVSALGLPSMLVVLAMTGVLRGLQDTRTPLVASVVGFTGNIALNVLFVYGVGLGIAGAAWGTVIAQTGMAVGLGVVVVRAARRHGAALRPAPLRILAAARTGVPLLVRTLALRAAILLTTWVAARQGDVPLAAFQVASTIWTFLTFALDSLAIAAQALLGKALGAGDVRSVRVLTRLMVLWGVGAGIALGIAVALLAPVLPALFSPDSAVRVTLTAALLVIALMQPVAAVAFVLDGVLIGAGDGRWLAAAQTVLLFLYAPLALAVHAARGPLLDAGTGVAVAALWAAFSVFMGMRALALWLRSRTEAWIVTGSA